MATEIDKGKILVFFLVILHQSLCTPVWGDGFPVIQRLDNRDALFRQFISDVESNRRYLYLNARMPAAAASSLTIYRYTPGLEEDIFFLAARCNIPYSSLATLNRLESPAMLESGVPLLLPSCPGIFIPETVRSELEKLVGAARFPYRDMAEIIVNSAAGQEKFFFFPGADFSPTERVFFLNSFFRFPLSNYQVTSTFGMRQSPITGEMSVHQGLDLAAPEGTPVYAAAGGIVSEIGENSVYGIYIIIRHSDRLSSLYGHLQKTEIALRSEVISGTLIGRVGTTGQSTGPHLHFELRQDGRAFDPQGRLRP